MKSVILTGASAGIGFEAARGLAAAGIRLGIVCRDSGSAEHTRRRLVESTGNEAVEPFAADLSSQRQVRAVAEEIRRRFDRVDVLVNNAAAIYSHRTVSEDGVEMQLAVNHLAPFLLTHLLLDRLRAADAARIVNVTSRAHARARIDFENLQGERRYSAMAAYGQSKLALVLFTYELARRLGPRSITVNCVHPGLIATEIGYKHAVPVHRLLHWILLRFAAPVAEGARPLVHLALSPEVEGRTGGYYAWTKLARSSLSSRDEALARRLWEVSAALTGIAPG